MNTTSVSLLEKLRQPTDSAAWDRFVDLYTPLLFYWGRRAGLQSADAADLVQDVFEVLVRKLPEFEYDRQQSFRSWLRTVTMNKWKERVRRRTEHAVGGSAVNPLEPTVPDGAEQFWETEYHGQLAARALDLMRTQFEPATWQACWESVVNDRPAAEIAAELGLTVNAVYLARSRVLRRLRQDLAHLWD
jgi:RNA polymerase sigma-70 factor (ECF subfamily)